MVSKTRHMDMIYENHILKEVLGVERGRGQVEIWLVSKIGLELLQGIRHLITDWLPLVWHGEPRWEQQVSLQLQ